MHHLVPCAIAVIFLPLASIRGDEKGPRDRELELLVESLADEKGSSLRTMKKIAAFGERAVPLLLPLLKQDGERRYRAVRVLGMIGKPAKDAAGPLADLLRTEPAERRAALAYALALIGPDARAKAVPALIPLLHATNREAQDGFYALERVGIDSGDVPAVLKAAAELEDLPRLAHRYPPVLAWGGKGAVTALTTAIGHEKPHVRLIAIQSLGKIGPDAKTAASVGALAAATKDATIRVHAAEALVAIGASAKAAVSDLIRDLETTGRLDLLRTTEWRYTCPAAAVLGRIPEAVPSLLGGLDNEHEMVRIGCLAALAAHGKKAAAGVPKLKKMLATRSKGHTHEFVAAALLELDPAWVRKAVEAGPEPKSFFPPRHLRHLLPALTKAAVKEFDPKTNK